jgi:hypothetical protein
MLAMLAFSLTACASSGSGGPDAGAPTIGSANSTTSAGPTSSAPQRTAVAITPDPSASPDRKLESQLHSEWHDRWLSCMRDNGYDPQIRDDGGVEFDGDPEAVSAQVAVCSTQAGPDVTYAPITAAEADQLYDMELAANACLAEHGVAITDPPSREQYVDAVLNQHAENGVIVSEDHWQAFDAVLDWAHWEKICPFPTLWIK